MGMGWRSLAPALRRRATSAVGQWALKEMLITGLFKRGDIGDFDPSAVAFFISHNSGVNELLFFFRACGVFLRSPHLQTHDDPAKTAVVRDTDDRRFEIVPFEVGRAFE